MSKIQLKFTRMEAKNFMRVCNRDIAYSVESCKQSPFLVFNTRPLVVSECQVFAGSLDEQGWAAALFRELEAKI